jgi:hypothetical protein
MFAACPQIESCWKPSVQVGEMIPTGSISPMSPFFATWPEPVDTEDGLQTALKNINFEIPQTDGAIVQWGSSSLDQSVIYEAHGPIVSLRTNSVTNPSFANNTSGWTPTAGTIARVAAGGVDGGAYGHFDATGAAKLQSPLLDGWFGQVTSSFALRGTGTVTVSIVAADDGAVISTQVVSLLADWERTYLGANYGRDVFLEFTGTDDFDIDQVMLEAGPTELPYFDGSIAPYDPLFLAEPIGHYVMAWTATAGNSVSTMHWVGEVDWTPTPGTQALALKESCDPAFRVYLMTTAGTIPSGMMNVGLREGIPPSIQARTYQRFFHGVSMTRGMQVISDYAFDNGAAVEVDFVLTAGTPFAYGTTDTVILRLPLSTADTQPFRDDGIVCTVPDTSPIIDPDCPPLPSPPRPPVVPNICIDDVTQWQRYVLNIPGDSVSAWSQMLPTITLNTPPAADARQVRVRFTPNPFDRSSDIETRENLMGNPTAQVNISNWTLNVAGAGNTGNIVRISAPDSNLPAGVTTRISGTATIATASAYMDVRHAAGGMNLVTAGQTYIGSGYMRSSYAGTANMYIQWLDAGGSVIGTVTSSGLALTASGPFTRISVSGVVPAGAVRAQPIFRVNGTPVVGSFIQVAAVLLESGSVLLPYFDGSTPVNHGTSYSWEGAVGLSPSLSIHSSIDPCAYCSEFILSYLPPGAELTVDALTQTAFVSVAGGPPRPASHLLYGTGGTPITWPSLSCGISYVMTIDVPPTDVSNVLVSVSLTSQE